MKKKLKEIPRFNSEDEERDFWAKADTTDYLNWDTAKKVGFPNLKPSTETISLRLPKGLLFNIKRLANKNDMPYQSMMKYILFEKIKEQTTH